MSTFADVARGRRSKQFVGRATELDVIGSALRQGQSGDALLYVHGPGGVGKTALLEAVREAADEGARRWVWIDAAAVPTVLPAVRSLVQPALDPDEPAVLILDSYEHLAHLDEWFVAEFVPGLPATTVVVVASRQPPSKSWLASPTVGPMTRVIPLRNLDRKESQLLLGHLDVDPTLRDEVTGVAHGHPLALTLYADRARRTGAVAPAPDLTAIILEAVVGDLPSDRHRRALEVCALARLTTEDLLREVLDEPDSHDVFEWLRGQTYVQAGTHGLHPHDIAREALDGDLSWRDPQRYEEIFRGLGQHLIRRMKQTRGDDQRRAILDAKYLHRYHPISRAFADWRTFGQSWAEPVRTGELDEVVDIIHRWEGPEPAALARRWYEAQPAGFFLVRHGSGRTCGTMVAVDLTAAPPEILGLDPVASATIDAVRRSGGLRPGERVTMMRFVADRESYQEPSLTMNVGPVLSIQHYLSTPGLAADALVLADTGRWDAYFDFFEIRRADRAPVEVGGRCYALFVRDFRRIPLDDWLALMLERDLSGLPTPLAGADGDELIALSRADFGDAVRSALRQLRRPDQLAANPLTRSRLVPPAGDRTASLAAVLRDAIERVDADPRSAKLARVLSATYVHGAPTQEKAAELLDLPMTTYKRHLRRGIEHVTDVLWQREIAGI